MGPFLETPGLVRLKSQNENEKTDSKTKAKKKSREIKRRGIIIFIDCQKSMVFAASVLQECMFLSHTSQQNPISHSLTTPLQQTYLPLNQTSHNPYTRPYTWENRGYNTNIGEVRTPRTAVSVEPHSHMDLLILARWLIIQAHLKQLED